MILLNVVFPVLGAVEQGVVKCFASQTSRLDKHAQILYILLLSDKVIEAHGSECALKVLIRAQPLVAYVKFFCH